MRRVLFQRRHHLWTKSLYIDGVARERSPQDVISPLGGVLGQLSNASREDAEDAVRAAQRSLGAEWDRPSGLRAMASYIRSNVERLAVLETKDCGKPIAETRGDIEYCADIFDYYADLEIEHHRGDKYEIHRGPRGVCTLISPWNYPLM